MYGDSMAEMPATKSEDKFKSLDDLSIRELQMRAALCGSVAMEAMKNGDERYHEPQRQQRILNEVLVRKIREQRARLGEEEPPNITIGMQPLRLTARRMGIS